MDMVFTLVLGSRSALPAGSRSMYFLASSSRPCEARRATIILSAPTLLVSIARAFSRVSAALSSFFSST